MSNPTYSTVTVNGLMSAGSVSVNGGNVVANGVVTNSLKPTDSQNNINIV
jgi:hypothetical protein